MIEELTDDEIIEYLMTSDFVENYRPEEYKFLLLKFKSFYRILYGNFTRVKGDLQFELDKNKNYANSLELQLENSQNEISKLKDNLNNYKEVRKLTWIERIKGKVQY